MPIDVTRYHNIRFERRERILTATLNRESALNAVNG